MDVDDIAQELRLKIWKALDRYDPNKSSIRTFAVITMNNHLRNLFRLAKNKPLNRTILFCDMAEMDKWIMKNL